MEWRVFSRAGLDEKVDQGVLGPVLIVMGLFHGRHSQCLMEFVSSKCRIQGNLVALGSVEQDKSTQAPSI